MNKKIIYFLIFMVICLSGCAKFRGLMTLRRYGDNQKRIERYLSRQEKLFDKLLQDMHEGKLREGMPKRQFITIYGDPILSRADDVFEFYEVLLYRHPTNYFTSDRIYVYFDESKKLIRWKYKPYQKPE